MGPSLKGAKDIPHFHSPPHAPSHTQLKLSLPLVAVGGGPVVLSWVGFVKVIGP